MKRILILFLIMLIVVPVLGCAQSADWAAAPVITKAYELSSGKLYLEWEGNAPLYQVYMDGKSVADVIVQNAVIPIEKGTHTLLVYPINESAAVNTTIDLSINAETPKLAGQGINVGGSIGFDLAALGLDHKNLTAGTPSAPLNIDYTPNLIGASTPDKPDAATDAQNCVLLSFDDRYNADEYLVSIKAGKDVNYVRFNRHEEAAAGLISKTNTTVTLALSADYLQSQGCMVPELDSKYTFTVQLRKYAANLLDGQSVPTVIHESKESGGCTYTPAALWKMAPVITYASQTADGQVTLEWTHDDNGLGCEYAVKKISKKLMIQTGAEELATVQEKTFVVNDLMNGDHSFTITPVLGKETGDASEEVRVEVKNDWVVAPSLTCETADEKSVRLAWAAENGVESYHITVYAGDSESLLRFVDLDYKEYAKIELPAATGEMEHVFVYKDEIDPAAGVKLKFEIYGVRHSASGEEQKTAVSVQTLTIGQATEEVNPE